MTIKSVRTCWKYDSETGALTDTLFDILIDGESMEACLDQQELEEFKQRVIEILKDYQ